MFNILICKGIANQNDTEIPYHPSQNSYSPRKQQMEGRMLEVGANTVLMGVLISVPHYGKSVWRFFKKLKIEAECGGLKLLILVATYKAEIRTVC
jgi:hypothetical protein